MSQTITVVAQVVAKKESVAAVKSELIKMVAPTRHEEGCLEYRLHQDNADPGIFIFYETWEDEESLARHKKSPHYQAYLSAVADLLEDKTVNLLSLVE